MLHFALKLTNNWTAKTLSARLASRRPVAAAPPSPAPTPTLIPVAPRESIISPQKLPSKGLSEGLRKAVPPPLASTPTLPSNNLQAAAESQPRKESRKTTPPPSTPPLTAPINSLQAAADTLDDLFNIVPDESLVKTKPVKDRKQVPKPPSQPKQPFAGLSWTPDGGKQSTRPKPSPRRQTGVSRPRRELTDEEAETLILSQMSEEDIEELDEANEEKHVVDPDDLTLLDGISLLGPQSGQTTQIWYENLIAQNREPEMPSLLTPDIEISPDMHSLFGIDRAQRQRRLTSILGVLQRVPPQVRPAAKKGKVAYQVRRILRRHGGSYSHLQPNIVPTNLVRRMKPSQVALLAMSRRAEARTHQRKQLQTVLASTLKTVDTVQYRHTA